ncbi:hypothetical protein HJG60_012101 [Phyllostomus discolor]|uniref:Uncharacterized protein n=1 Tax=Phyllostomus discolor TaxID=89673 RepID=A0A834DWR1_9CHIR|nr:hypothetical protein HJG60_012101 [Phyllostomus discolor]
MDTHRGQARGSSEYHLCLPACVEGHVHLEKKTVQILKAHEDNNNNLLSGKGSLRNQFLPQVKTTMIINKKLLDKLLLALKMEPQVTPNQKALIVALIKKYQNLAIRDGANDVNMIKTEDTSVELAGRDGIQWFCRTSTTC